MSQNGKLMPNLDQNSTKLLNLTVLQRIDPFVAEILMTAAHVTFYEFNIDLSQWSRKDVEGSLFVVKRNTQPRFQFIVMNRRNTDNLVENLLGDFEYEVQVPYLLYRNAEQEVNGIWFYNARECEEVASLFSRILNAYSKVPSKPKVSSTKSEFEELEAVPSMAVMDGPLEPSPSTNANIADVPEDTSFVNFFSTATTLRNASNVTVSGQSYESSAKPFPSSHTPSSVPHSMPDSALSPSPSLPSAAPFIPFHDNHEPISNSTYLVKPSTFLGPPPSSSTVLMPPGSTSMHAAALHPHENPPRARGAPLLQPFPPPTPPASLTPPSFGHVITRERVRDALLLLVQDDQFIDMFHRALQSVQQL